MMANTTSNYSKILDLTDEEKLLIVNIRLYVYGWIVLPIAIIGLILNGFTIIVLLHPKMRNFSTNVYLTTLSIANMACLLNFIFLYSLRYLVSYEYFIINVYQPVITDIHPYESFINFIYGIWSPIFTTFQLYAIYLTVAVTVDRWIYVTWPLRADSICTMKNTFRTVIFIFVFCFTYNLPRWFEIESFQQVSITNRTYYQARTTKFGNHYIFNQIMRRYGYLIFVYGLPFTILLCINIGIVKQMIEAKRRKKKLLGANDPKKLLIKNGIKCEFDKKKKRQSVFRSNIVSPVKLDPKITFMVIAVVLAFFICQFPYLVLNILATAHANKKWFHITKPFCDLLAAINCCVNFIIYCFFGHNFREIAKIILFNPSMNPYNRALYLKNQMELAQKLKSSYTQSERPSSHYKQEHV
ncbi:unnamed protein product [Brachionus calyciflorus]|uniref:G-protein coupled receptors family 1 profile domain-containing protein n=1 Tax=Brachionus calyciflorus TaxID=104777 RepID=A0A814CAJ8_9BILA|nr:unnamed protein product [Brachionus calyciflorus]